MSEAKRYWADMVPLTWDSEGVGKVQEVYLASDYDALLAKARRLRAALLPFVNHKGSCRAPLLRIYDEGDGNVKMVIIPIVFNATPCTCGLAAALSRESADLEVTP